MYMTVHTSVPKDADSAFFAAMAENQSKVKHKFYAAIAAGHDKFATFKKSFSEAHNLTSRQFNVIKIEVQGMIAGVRETLGAHAETIEQRIKLNKASIHRLDKMIGSRLSVAGVVQTPAKLKKHKEKLHKAKRKLARQEAKLSELGRRIETTVPGICFGGRKLFREQFVELPNEGWKPHAQRRWLAKWQAGRSAQFLFIGSKDEAAGCVSCQAVAEDDGTITLKIRPFNSMLPVREAGGKPLEDMKRRKTTSATISDYVIVKGVRFGYEHKRVLDVLRANQSKDINERTPLTWRFLRDDGGRWKVHLSFDTSDIEGFDGTKGAIGIDFNEDHIAATIVDRHGNFIGCKRFVLNLYGLSSGQALDKIRCVARDVVRWAKELGLPIVAEDLDFTKKKRSMLALSAKRSRALSSLHYAAWGRALINRCHRDRVALCHVNPAYSSLIGRAKFATRHGLSVHHAAALVIARRGMKLSERLPSTDVRIPDGQGAHVTLTRVANIGQRHVWASWAKAQKSVQELLKDAAIRANETRRKAAHEALTAAKSSSAMSKAAELLLAEDYVPDFSCPATLDERSGTRDRQGAASVNPGEIPGRRPDLPVAGCLAI